MNQNTKPMQRRKIDNFLGAIEESPILLSQYLKNSQFDRVIKIILQ